MKTDVWVYTLWYLDKVWQGVFDCEVSTQQMAKAFFDETGSIDPVTRMTVEKHTLFRHKRDELAVIPEVQSATLFSLEKNLSDEKWFEDELLKLTLDQSTLNEYLRNVQERHGQIAALVGVVVYKLIESQIEANRL